MSLVFPLLALTLLQAAKPTPADEAFDNAKGEYQKLVQDKARSKLRHHWLNAAARLEKVATRYPKSDSAPEAMYLAGHAYKQLSQLSGNREDVQAAERCATKLKAQWPKHKRALALSKGTAVAESQAPPATPSAGSKSKAMGAATATKGPASAAATKPVPAASGSKQQEPAKSVAARRAAPAPSPKPAEPNKRPTTGKEIAKADAAEKEKDKEEESPFVAAIRAAVEADRAKLNAEAPRPDPSEVPGEREADDAEASDEVNEGPTATVITALQEKLRDVRVGQPEVPLAAKQRLKGAAARHRDDELSLVEQLGLKYRRVVIDAGHGGHDTGAIGPTGVREKDVTLAIALKLKDRLMALGLDVVLTRADDRYLHLEERSSLANSAKGDLFISIHCNAAPRKEVRGIETYTLNTSSDRYAIRLAARENSTSRRGVNDLRYILADLATKANTDDSAALAERVQRSMVRTLKTKHSGVRDLGTKEALFHVLLGAKMPAILVETSFLSNPEEEKLLASKSYQEDTASAIADAVKDFLDGRGTLAAVERR